MPRLGYNEAARLAKIASEEGRTVREVAAREAGLPADELERLLDPERMSALTCSRTRHRCCSPLCWLAPKDKQRG